MSALMRQRSYRSCVSNANTRLSNLELFARSYANLKYLPTDSELLVSGNMAFNRLAFGICSQCPSNHGPGRRWCTDKPPAPPEPRRLYQQVSQGCAVA